MFLSFCSLCSRSRRANSSSRRFCSAVRLVGRHDFDDDVLVATCAAMHDRHAHALEAERAVALRARRDLERGCFAVHRGHLNLIAKGGLGKADGQFVDDVVALPFEERVRLDGENNVQVARRAATRTDFSLAGHAHIDAIIDARRNIDHHAAIVAHATLTTALLTGRGDDTCPRPGSVRTSSH